MTDFVESSNPEFPLKITTKAADRLVWALASEDFGPGGFVRVSVKGGGCSGYVNSLDFSDELDTEEDIETIIITTGLPIEGRPNSAKIVMDSFSALYLKDVVLDFISEQFKEGFSFTGGGIKSTCGCGSSVRY